MGGIALLKKKGILLRSYDAHYYTHTHDQTKASYDSLSLQGLKTFKQ